MTANLPSQPPSQPPHRADARAPSSGAESAWLAKLRPHKPRRSGSVDAEEAALPSTTIPTTARRPSAGTAAYVPRHARSDFAALPMPTSYRDSVAFRYAGRAAADGPEQQQQQQQQRRRRSSAATGASASTTASTPPASRRPSLFDETSGPSSRSSSYTAATGFSRIHWGGGGGQGDGQDDRGTEAWVQQTAAATAQQHHAGARAPVWTKVAAYIRPVRTSVSD